MYNRLYTDIARENQIKTITAIILLVIGHTAYGDSIAVSGFDSDCTPTDTIEAAAIAALTKAKGFPTVYEWGGAIYAINDKYCYTQPVTSESSTTFTAVIRPPRPGKIVALYHTHPGDNASDKFSSIDVATATKMKILSYIYDTRSHKVLVFDPRLHQVKPASMRDAARGLTFYSKGAFVTQLE